MNMRWYERLQFGSGSRMSNPDPEPVLPPTDAELDEDDDNIVAGDDDDSEVSDEDSATDQEPEKDEVTH